MTNSGYFVFWSRAALLVEELAQQPRRKDYCDRETWAIVVGRFGNLHRNPDMWRRSSTPAHLHSPKGLHELTLMFVEKHGHELYHLVGMEREIDESKTAGWKWTYRCFRVGGPGRGERKRFSTSVSGPVFVGDEEEFSE